MRELSLNVLDIAQNSIAADASQITITLAEDTEAGDLLITIQDNGCGMTAEQLGQVQNPFFSTRSTRKIGLGVPFFKMACEMTGGSFAIESTLGVGTLVKALFHTRHIDMTPMGNMNETILLLISCNPAVDFVYSRSLDKRSLLLDARELRQVLGDVPLDSADVVQWVRGFLGEQQAALVDPDIAF